MMYLRVYNMDRGNVGSCKATHVNGVEVHDDNTFESMLSMYIHSHQT